MSGSMISRIKRSLKITRDRMLMFFEFYHDYKDYKKWNYNNPKIKTRCAQESKILRQTHMIEKGLSLTNPREGFGIPKIQTLFIMLDDYLDLGFPTDGIPFQNALGVLSQYVKIQKQMGFESIELNNNLKRFEKYILPGIEAGIAHSTLDDITKEIHKEFPDFFLSRHSMRQFSDRKINFDDVRQAVKLAMKAPTACNRQACKVYFYEESEINKKLGELIAGNTGFDGEVQNYLVVTSDLSAFYDTFERNQIYIEAGIFAMSLIQSLHYYGIGSCALQNGEYHKKNIEFKRICGNIPENEKIAIFIAIGYYKDEFNYAISKRKNVEDILIKR